MDSDCCREEGADEASEHAVPAGGEDESEAEEGEDGEHGVDVYLGIDEGKAFGRVKGGVAEAVSEDDRELEEEDAECEDSSSLFRALHSTIIKSAIISTLPSSTNTAFCS